MRHILLPLLALMSVLTGYAGVTTTDFFSQDFIKMADASDYPTDGWTTLGNGAEPTEYASYYFNADGKGPYYTLLSYGELTMAMANTEFTDGAEADEWLISPAIEVPYDNAALLFTACAFANKGQGMGIGANTFKVLVSDSGTDKADFKEVIIDTNVRGSASTEVTTKKLVAPVNGYKGKKIHLAFVVTGSNVGFTGFTNLRMGQYILDVTNYTQEVAELDEPISIDINIGLKTPVECDYIDAVLSINGVQTEEREYKKTFGSTTSYIMLMQRMIFEDAIVLTDDTPVSYTITLTPRFEGAVPSVLTGYVSTPGATYPSNLVIEEFTATGCGWCTRGIAALQYYKDTYTGKQGTGKAIPIAIHGYMNYFDPMSEGVEDYLTRGQGLNGTSGLPAAIFNRATRGIDPAYVNEAARLIAESSYNKVTISSVERAVYSGDAELPAIEARVDFKVRNGYNTGARPLNAAVVLIENDVTGFNSGYNQTNYYADYTPQQVTDLHDAALLPYLAPFIADGELNYKIVPYTKMVYQHVARGIYPDFFGQELASEWVSDTDREFYITFTVPSTVENFDNTEVVVLVIDPSTQAIVASDIMPASNYTDGVEEVSTAAAARVQAIEGTLRIDAADGTDVSVYALDGTKLASVRMTGGVVEIPASYTGMAIVRLTLPDGSTETHKIIL